MTPTGDIFGIRVVSCKHKGWTPGWWVRERDPTPGFETTYTQAEEIETIWTVANADRALADVVKRYGKRGVVFELVRFSAQPPPAG